MVDKAIYLTGGHNEPPDVWTTFEAAEQCLLSYIRRQASKAPVSMGFGYEIWKVIPNSQKKQRFTYWGSMRTVNGVTTVEIRREKRNKEYKVIKPRASDPPNLRWTETITVNPNSMRSDEYDYVNA